MFFAELLKVRSHKLPWVVSALLTASATIGAFIASTAQTADTVDVINVAYNIEYLIGSLLAVVVGAWMGGQEFGWGTWRVILGRDSRRSLHLLTKAGVMLLAVAVMSLAAFGVSATAGAAFAAASGRASDVGGLPGAALSVLFAHVVWATIGFAVGVATRSTPVAITAGLVYLVVADNILAIMIRVRPFLVGQLLGVVANDLTLTSDLTAPVPGDAFVFVSTGRAVATIAVYLAVLLGVAWVTFVRRDVT
jgi:ABC-2 type transport system permease protein